MDFLHMDLQLVAIFSLLIAYQLKHFVADYPLQGEWMLGKFKPGWDFLVPLAAHAGTHGVFTFCIAFWFVSAPLAVILAVFDFVAHFVMDRIKAGPKYLGHYKPHEPQFWYALGFDQMVHHLTHYIIIYVLVKNWS